MFSPFDHVEIQGVEFTLHYRCTKSHLRVNAPEWHAIDLDDRKVIVSERFMQKLDTMGFEGSKQIVDPVYFMSDSISSAESTIRIHSRKLVKDIKNGLLCGTFVNENDDEFKWDIRTLSIYKNGEEYKLNVFTMGGVYI